MQLKPLLSLVALAATTTAHTTPSMTKRADKPCAGNTIPPEGISLPPWFPDGSWIASFDEDCTATHTKLDPPQMTIIIPRPPVPAKGLEKKGEVFRA